VGERLEKFGSAFADYAKGAPEEALSRLQDVKLREIRAKARAESKAKVDPEGEPGGVAARAPSAWGRRTPLRARAAKRRRGAEADDEA
jgi:hypothetical protein